LQRWVREVTYGEVVGRHERRRIRGSIRGRRRVHGDLRGWSVDMIFNRML